MDSVFALASVDYAEAIVRIAGVIGFCALGVLLCWRAGIILIGVEGILLFSTFAAIAGSAWTGSLWFGVCLAAAAGISAALLLGVLTITLRAGDVIGGLILLIAAIGMTGFLQEQWFPTGATTGGKLLTAPWPEFRGGVVALVFHQQPLIYLMLFVGVFLNFFLRSRLGLRVRASGESIDTAVALGINLVRLRFAVLAASGGIVGLGGAVLGVGIFGTFSTDLVHGQGFIGLACVLLGAWRVAGTLGAVAFFGVASALQFQLELGELGAWLQVLPYFLVLVVISGVIPWARQRGPAEAGMELPEQAR